MKIPFYALLLAILILTIAVSMSLTEGFRADQEKAPRERPYPLIPRQPEMDGCSL